MSFILKGYQISVFQLKGWVKSKTWIQEYRNEIQNSYYTCTWIIWYVFLVQMWRIKNRPSTFTACSDNALRLLVLMTVFQDSKMSFQSMNSTSNPLRSNASFFKGHSYTKYVLASSPSSDLHSKCFRRQIRESLIRMLKLVSLGRNFVTTMIYLLYLIVTPL